MGTVSFLFYDKVLHLFIKEIFYYTWREKNDVDLQHAISDCKNVSNLHKEVRLKISFAI